MKIENVKEYKLLQKKEVKDLSSMGYLLQHKKSGARVLILENDDRNKVFYIAFRTPPEDSCGTPHIIEHTVLCGSEKYRAKDPFVELAKGSLNTFLNAMTYPDKTVYPVASTNDQDFRNLSDVYMDAVLHPAIYKNEKIFRQEGWHYEMESPSDELKLNGVVYNEMKGAFSSPEDVLARYTVSSLYPETAYALESGGDPEEIPDLSYERFLDLHRKYYHPSNSYIYIYGDADMEERLAWLDREYLSKYGQDRVDSRLTLQKPFTKMARSVKKYSIAEGEELKDNTYLAYNCVVGDSLDPKLCSAFSILQYALLDAPGAPLKQALLDARIGKDIESTYDNGILQPYFSVIAKYANLEDEERFLACIRDTLDKLVKEGLDKKAILAGINQFEFQYLEADYGTRPKGLMYGLHALDSWLYDETNPFVYIEQREIFAFLKEKAKEDKGYFEKLVKQYLLDNAHASLVILKPEIGLTAKKDAETAAKLAKYKASLSKEEVSRIVKETKELKKYQEAPSTKEELLTIPVLKVSDIEKKALPYKNEEIIREGIRYIYHDIDTKGIAYIGFMFSMQSIPERLIPYAGLMAAVLGLVDTEHYTYQELASEINLATGGIHLEAAAYPDIRNRKDFDQEMEIRIRVFDEQVPRAGELVQEILFTSDFSDRKRMLEIIQMQKSSMQSSMVSAGHATAMSRALSYLNDSAYYGDKLAGLSYYRFLCDLEKGFDAKKAEKTAALLKETLGILLHRDNLMVDVTSGRDALERVCVMAGSIAEKLDPAVSEPADIRFDEAKKNEGFRTASQVQYVAKAGNFADKGLSYRGELQVLRVIMGYDYLWNQIRVLGGAYGCSSAYTKTGYAMFASYRDPHLKRTLEVYDKAAEYVENFKADRRDMDKYIIGTISDLDIPLPPQSEGRRSLRAYMSYQTDEMAQKERDEILGCSAAKIRELAPYLKAAMSDEAVCVVGAEEKIDSEKGLFMNVENLH
ncbi:MAG: insulinase family protein [Lachnospiraceae bacterium]|nr:insulinase family protein [Lachnospiraceae bacterium]